MYKTCETNLIKSINTEAKNIVVKNKRTIFETIWITILYKLKRP